MTDPNDSLVASLETFEQFGKRFAEGVATRIDGESSAATPEITTSTRDALCAEAASGALLGRTAWGGEGAERSGCFLWIGDVEALVGDGEKLVSDLTDDDVQMLDQALRLNIEEAADGPPPLEWSALELLSPERVGDALRETGIPAECEVCRLTVRVKDREQTFLFLMAPATEAETQASDAEAAAGDEPQETGAESQAAGESPDAPAPEPASEPTAREDETPDEAAARAAVQAASSSAEDAGVSVGVQNLHHLLNVRMPLTVRLGSTRMSLQEVLRLAQGSILELDRREEEPLEVLANEHVIARGEVVVVDERFGLRITDIGSSSERMRASRG